MAFVDGPHDVTEGRAQHRPGTCPTTDQRRTVKVPDTVRDLESVLAILEDG
jgi:hypothetical protein